MSGGKSFRFVDTPLDIQTGLNDAGAKTISGITMADPVVFASAAHGFDAAAVVKTSGIAAPTQLDERLIVVDNPATGTFEGALVDAADYDEFSDGSPPDAKVTPVTFAELCELTGVNQQDGGADQHEVTTRCSTAKEFKQGLSDPGTLQLDFNWAGNETVQAAMRAAKRSGEQIAFRLRFPDDGGTVIMLGTVQQTSFQGTVSDGVYRASATIRLSGDIYVLEAA